METRKPVIRQGPEENTIQIITDDPDSILILMSSLDLPASLDGDSVIISNVREEGYTGVQKNTILFVKKKQRDEFCEILEIDTESDNLTFTDVGQGMYAINFKTLPPYQQPKNVSTSFSLIQKKLLGTPQQKQSTSNISIKSKDTSDKNILVKVLQDLGVIKDSSELNSFLARRQQAIDWNLQAAKSNYVEKNETKNIKRKEPAVFMFYDNTEYKNMTPEEFETNLYLLSIGGGRETANAYGEHHRAKRNEILKNPLNLPQCPQYNVKVATGLELASSGGYFGSKVKEFNPPPKITVLHAYAYEFENFDASRIINNECPFITIQNLSNTQPLLVGIDKGDFTINQENATKLYLKTEDYKQFIKDNLLRQMRAVVYSHQQAGLTDKPIQMNLTLPGLGFFAELGAKWSIKNELAILAAEGYKAALEDFDKEQINRIPKISHMRLTYDGRTKDEINGINAAFGSVEKIGNIKITKTTDLVENIDPKAPVYQVIVVNGDPRTYPGNEKQRTSQEPGIYSNIVNGRNALSAIINPFSVLQNVCTHDFVQQQIDKPIQITQLKQIDKLQSILESEQQKYYQRVNAKFNDIVIRNKDNKIQLRRTLSSILQTKLDLSDNVEMTLTDKYLTFNSKNAEDFKIIKKEFSIMNINPVSEDTASISYNISEGSQFIHYLTNQYENDFKKELGKVSVYEKMLLIGFEEVMSKTLGWSNPPPYFNHQGELIYTPEKTKKPQVFILDHFASSSNLISALKDVQAQKQKPHQLILAIEQYIINNEWKFDGMMKTYVTDLRKDITKDNDPNNLPKTIKKHWDDIQAYKKNPGGKDPILILEKIKSDGQAAAKDKKSGRKDNTKDYYNIFLESDADIENFFMREQKSSLQLKI